MVVRKLSSFLVLVLVASVLVGVPARPAEAEHSHFRYGNISWQPLGGNEVLFSFTAAFRRGYSGSHPDGRAAVGDIIVETIGATRFSFGDGASTPTLRFLVTSIDPANDWLMGVALQPGTNDLGLRHTYSGTGEYTAFSQTCCRFTHVNNSNGTYRLETTVTVGGTNRSPVSTMPPIVSCARDALCQFSVPAADADGDALTWRLASGSEWVNARQPGPPQAPNAASIDPATGVFTWDTTGANQSPFTSTPSGPKSYYSAQVVVTDAQGHTIPLDFLIQLVDEVGDPPVLEDLPECGSTVDALLGQQVTFDVSASDADPDDEVTLNVVGLPSGATTTPPLPLTGNPVSTVFSWTPQPGQEGAHVLQFTAIDTAGQTVLCAVTIDVEETPPLPPPLPVPGGPYTVPEGGAVILAGSADPGVDERPVDLAWDLDGDGEFDTSGATPRFDASALDGPDAVEVALRACNADGRCDTDTATIEVLNVPPEVDAGPDLRWRTGEPLFLDGRFADPAGDADAPYAATWTVEGDAEEQTLDHGEPVQRSVTFAEAGVYPAELEVTDADGDTGTGAAWVTVEAVDPDCSGAGPTVDLLWPPNHRMVEVGIAGVTHPGGDDVAVTVTGIYQDEPVNDVGDGNFVPDGEGVGTPTAWLRAERKGDGNGRFYHVFFEATTEAGGLCEGAVRVAVPHDRRPPPEPVDDGPLYDSTVPSDPDAPVPVAFGSRHRLAAGATLEVAAPGVLEGAVHPDGAGLTAQLEEPPAAGTLDLRADGSFTYTAPLHHGEFPFTFRASDGERTSAPATVTLTVLVPDFPLYVPDREVWTGEDTPVEFTLHARGEGSGEAAFALVGAPAHGTAVLDGDVVTYAPGSGFSGEDTLTYEATSGGATSNLGVLRLVVTPSNDTPVAGDVTAEAAEDSTVLIDVLAHASDADGDPLELVHLTEPGMGTAAIEDGQVRYTPAPDESGSDRFRYRVADPHGAVAAAWVLVTVTEVNDPPVTSDVHFTIDWDDGFLQVPASDLTTDDVPGPPDESDQTLAVTQVLATGDTHGTVELEAGVVTWTPDDELFVGVAHFRYEVCDDGTTAGEPDPQCALGDVSVTVEEVNRPPVALDQQVTTAEDTPLEITLEATDVNDDELTFAVVDPPERGTVVGLPPVVTYTPDPDEFGTDAFTFVANDGEFDSEPATVSITVTEVNDPPVTSDAVSTLEWGETELVVAAAEFAANDVPGPANESDQTLTVVGVEATAETHGTLAFDDGIVTYTPEEGFEGEARFTYEVCDDGTTAGEPDPLCATGTVVVNVAGPPPPEANDVEVTLAEDSHVAVDVTANDTHPDGLLFSVVEVSDPAHGVAAIVTMGPDEGSVFYQPDDDYVGPDQFVYTVEDTRGGRATATVLVTVTEVNDAPVTADVAYTITWLEVLEVEAAEFAANDLPGPPNEADQTLTVVAVEATADTHGTVVLDGGIVTYTPDDGFSGEARFAYEVCDDGTTAGEPDPLCATGDVFVTVEAVNRPPVAFDASYTTSEGVPVELTLEASDADGDELTYLLASLPEHGGLFGTPPELTYEPDEGFTGTDSFAFFASDGDLDSDLATVTITVQAAVVEALAVTPPSSFLEPGQERQLVATATLDTGEVVDVTGQAAWSSGDDAVATVDAGGLVTAVADGHAEITAAHAGLEATASVQVESIELDEIVVELSTGTLLVGESVELTATGVRADGTSEPLTTTAAWASDDQSVATLAGTDPVVVTVVGEGSATITATIGAVSGSATVTGVAPVGDEVAPTAVIASPEGGEELTGPAPVSGTADDDNLLKWVLDYSPAGESAFTALAEGTDAVLDGDLGTFDATTLLNDLYTLRLRVYDRGGNVATDEVVVQVGGGQKVGNFTVSYEDLSVPLSGMPLTITRVYDSRDRSSGDFGFGWRLDVRTATARTNRVHGTGWRMVSSGGLIPTYSLQPAAEHKVSITLADGHVEEFDMQPVPSSQQLIPPQFTNATYTARPGTRGTLAPLGNTGLFVTGPHGDITLLDDFTFEPYDPTLFLYTAPNGTRFQIHVRDGVRSIEDPNGNTLTIGAGGISHSAGLGISLTRDAQGRITAITDPAGNTQHYAYDVNGDLASHTDALGHATSFRYNRHHGLLEIVDASGNRPVRNEYDDDGRLVATVDPFGNRIEFDRDLDARVEVVRDRLGNVTVLAYDEAGNVVEETDPLGHTTTRSFDAAGNTLSETNALGETTEFTYDALGNVTTRTDPLGGVLEVEYADDRPLRVVDARGGETTFTYDASGNPLSDVDPLGNAATFGYDAAGNLTTATDRTGAASTFVYDSRGNPVRDTDPEGNTVERTFDAAGNVVSLTRERTVDGETVTLTETFSYDAANRLVEAVDAEGGVTTYSWTPTGKLASQTDPAGHTTTYGYDALDRQVSVTHPDGFVEETEYDAEGREVALHGRSGTVSLAYDAAGRLTQVTNPDGTMRTTAYDAAGRAVSVTDENGDEVSVTYNAAGWVTASTDALGNTTTYTHDADGNVTSRTDPLGHTTSYVHDAAGRLLRTVHPGGAEVSHTYDAEGRLLGTTDEAGATTTYDYDGAGRLATVTDPLGGVTSFGYDSDGNQVAHTDPLGNLTRAGYDRTGRLVSRTLPLGQTEERSYDAAGHLLSVTDPGGATTEHDYDALGRVVETRYPGGDTVDYTYTASGQIATITDARGLTTFTYDQRDRPVLVAYPDGTEIGYAYDAAGRRTSLETPDRTISYGYDAAGRLTSVADDAGASAAFGYDAAGNLVEEQLPGGVVVTYEHDARGQVTAVTQERDGTVLGSFAYELAPTGRRTRVTEQDGSTVDYAYDALGQLTQETLTPPGEPARSVSYTYDAAGNRLTRAGAAGATTYDYDANSRLTEVTAPGGAATTYDWDGAGRLLGRDGPAGSVEYDYGGHGRLERVEDSSGITTFAYDAFGNRVEATDAGGTTTYLVDPFSGGPPQQQDAAVAVVADDDGTFGLEVERLPQVLAETGPGGATARYLHAHDRLVALTTASGTSHVLADALGSTRGLVDAGGALTDTYAYDAFGVLTAHDGDSVNPFLFTGQRYDRALDAYDLRARSYDPAVGRFTSRDPFEGVRTDPLTLNPYLYARNDPVNLTDPSGQFFAGLSSVMVSTYVRFAYYAAPALYMINHVAMRLGTSSIAMSVRLYAHSFTSGVYRLGGLHPRLLNLHAGQVFEKLLNPAMRMLGAARQVRIQNGRAIVDWITRQGTLVDAKLGGHISMSQFRFFAAEASRRSGQVTYITLRAPPQSTVQALTQEAARRGVNVNFITLFPF